MEQSQVPEISLVASAPTKVRRGDTLKTVRRKVYRVKGKNGADFLASQDSRGRIYMVDPYGNLYYDTGMSQIGWYMVEPGGEMYNLYQTTEGKVEKTHVGNISEIKKFQMNGWQGVDIPTRPIWAFDEEPTILPPGAPELPYEEVETADGKKKLIPPRMLEEGEINLERKFTLNPFRKDEGFGGPLHRGPEGLNPEVLVVPP